MQLARDRDSGPAAPPIPRSDARCGRRRSVSRRPNWVEPVGGYQWKPGAEKAVSNRLSHMQCTGLRKFRNSAIESLRSISSQLPVPYFKSMGISRQLSGLDFAVAKRDFRSFLN